jgi:hypothetical protein
MAQEKNRGRLPSAARYSFKLAGSVAGRARKETRLTARELGVFRAFPYKAVLHFYTQPRNCPFLLD